MPELPRGTVTLLFTDIEGSSRLLHVGLEAHRAARLMSAGHGGQLLISQTTRELLGDDRQLRDLGERRLKDLSRPLRSTNTARALFEESAMKTSCSRRLPLLARDLVTLASTPHGREARRCPSLKPLRSRVAP